MPLKEEGEAWGVGEGGLPTVYTLRSRRVMVHRPSHIGKRKRKQRPKSFKPSKALCQAIERFEEKLKRKVSKTPNMVTDTDSDSDSDSDMEEDSDSDSDSDMEEDTICENLSLVSSAECPLSRPSTVDCTPKVIEPRDWNLKKTTFANIDKYGIMANLALEYYNFKEHANLKLSEVIVASQGTDRVRRVHINFTASSNGHSESLLFAELINDRDKVKFKLSGFHVQGCCVIEKVDSGNPLGCRCRTACSTVEPGASEEVMHPGPAYGYRVISGDVFEGYAFWEYRRSAYEEYSSNFKPRDRRQHPEMLDIYVVSAKKALEYFNSKQQRTKFKDAQVTAGAHYQYELKGTVIHISFMAQLLSGSEQEIFFAVLSIPPFSIDGDWENWKEPFVKVEACCRLEQVDSGNPFGRVCRLCRVHNFESVGTVIHPSPRDGYTAADGDDFAGYDFMTMGTGIY